MQEDSQPLAMLYGYRSNRNKLSFIGRKGLITLSGKRRTIERILRLCNGMNSARDIINQLSHVGSDAVNELLSLCEAHGIVRDSRNLHERFHEDSSNPPTFSYDLQADDMLCIMESERLRSRDGEIFPLLRPITSELLQTIQKRRSVRQFQEGQIPSTQLSGLLEATYGVGENGHWSVPSGGSMYPLDLYLIIPNNRQVLRRGTYRWDPEKHEVSVMSDKSPTMWLTKVFNTKGLLEHAAVVLCVATNLRRVSSKYANRAYRLALLEAGHAAQNAYLYCAEQDIGIVEYGGFCDEALTRELGLHLPHEIVVTTLIVGIADDSGRQSSSVDQGIAAVAQRLQHTLVGNGKPIIDVVFWEPMVKGYAMSQWAATATYRPSHGRSITLLRRKNRGFATGATSSEAVTKALAEGFERYALGQNRTDRTESLVQLDEQFLDPRLVVPYSPVQYTILKDFEPFDPREKIDWVFGIREANGERVCVPRGLVFFASDRMQERKKPFYRASSSGVAAHVDKRIAIETALYELIERDAFSVMWYAKRHVRAIPHHCFPDDLKSRISSWENLGYHVSLLDLTLDGPPVALALIWSSERKPALSSGAGCRLSLLDAAERAFTEAEFMAVTWHHRKPRPGMNIRDIKSIDDHGLFYVDPKNLVHIEWLLKAEKSEVRTKNFDGDLNSFDPIVVDITPTTHGCGLTVVRVLSDRLMPINFGYGSEHRGHPRMNTLHFKWSTGYPSIPHFFA